jgi:hypothetical protein
MKSYTDELIEQDEYLYRMVRTEIIEEIENDLHQKFLRAMRETIEFILNAKDREVALEGVSYALLSKSSKKMSMRDKALELGELSNGKDKKSVLSRHKIAYQQILSDLSNGKDINHG